MVSYFLLDIYAIFVNYEFWSSPPSNELFEKDNTLIGAFYFLDILKDFLILMKLKFLFD